MDSVEVIKPMSAVTNNKTDSTSVISKLVLSSPPVPDYVIKDFAFRRHSAECELTQNLMRDFNHEVVIKVTPQEKIKKRLRIKIITHQQQSIETLSRVDLQLQGR